MLFLQQMKVTQSLHVPAFPPLLFELRLLMTLQEHAVVEVLKRDKSKLFSPKSTDCNTTFKSHLKLHFLAQLAELIV